MLRFSRGTSLLVATIFLLSCSSRCLAAMASFTPGASTFTTTLVDDVTFEFTRDVRPVFLSLFVTFDEVFSTGTTFSAFTASSSITGFGQAPQQVRGGLVNGNNPANTTPRDYSLQFDFFSSPPSFFTGDQVVLSAGTHIANLTGSGFAGPAVGVNEYQLRLIDLFGNVVGEEIEVEEPGDSPENPILPLEDPNDIIQAGCDPDTGFCLSILPSSNQGPTGDPIWIDPEIAIGYDYDLVSGPNFASVTLPSGFGDDSYELYGFDDNTQQFVLLQVLTAMQTYDFTQFNPLGVSKFRVLGIEESAMVDADDPLGFPTGVTFMAPGAATLTMTAIVPEPGMLVLLGGSIASGILRSRRPSPSAA